MSKQFGTAQDNLGRGIFGEYPFPLTNENSCITTTQEKSMILYWK